METATKMHAQTLQVAGRPTRVHVGGPDAADAQTMLLLHGGWGGAELHWSPIWDRLAERFHVVAPELPGFGHGTEGGPLTVPEFAAWVQALLGALGIERAWLVGNAFGGAVGWQLATVARARATGLLLLNGGPPPPQPWLLRKFFALPFARAFVRHALRAGLFGPRAVEKGFAEPSRAPAPLRALLAQPDPVPMRLLVETIMRGGATEDEPRVPVLMLWGEADQLPGTDSCAMDRLVDTGNPPRFETIPGAGHLPQLEAPQAVVERILAFVADPTPKPTAAPAPAAEAPATARP